MCYFILKTVRFFCRTLYMCITVMDSFLNVNLWLKYCWQAHVTCPLRVASSKLILYDFFLSCSDHFYFLVVGVENYCSIWLYSVTHTIGMTPLDEGSAPSQRPLHVQDTTFISDRYPYPGGIRIRNSSKRAAADPCLRPRGRCDRLSLIWTLYYPSMKSTTLKLFII